MRKMSRTMLIDDLRGTLLMGIPGLLYCIQNNLYFLGISNLSITVFQVTSQAKIFLTAFLSVILLSKRLGAAKWFALFGLAAGIALVDGQGDLTSHGNMAVGIGSVIVACAMSAFAGVYIEMQLKTAAFTIWERNVQLSVYGVMFGILTTFVKDWNKVHQGGFFQGYNPAVVLAILLLAVGGLLVAAVLKYADNLLKCFAVAAGLVISTVCSRVIFDEGPLLSSWNFICGAIAVVCSTTLYSLGWEGVMHSFDAHMKPPAMNVDDKAAETKDQEALLSSSKNTPSYT